MLEDEFDKELIGDRQLREVTLTQIMTPALSYVPGSASIEPAAVITSSSGTTLTWRWERVEAMGPHAVTYGLAPNRLGTFEITGTLGLWDDEGRRGSYPMAPQLITVSTACPTPVPPTPIPTATDTPTPTWTPSPTPLPTATASPTRTPRPAALYLPLALREQCRKEYQWADVALVIDTSNSMSGPKLADAREAALTFVGLMDLGPGRDQVAVIGFDKKAEVAHPLSTDRSGIEGAIGALVTGAGTLIDRGLRAALGELEGPRRIEANVSVVVLLTDGNQSGGPAAALEAAADVREAGVELFVIGLGADTDEATLRQMAAQPGHFFVAPDSRQLADIYALIAQEIQCPPSDFWPYRP
jgi:uncharacterized protein YegL